MVRVPTLVLVLAAAFLALPSAASAQERWTSQAETCGGYNTTERGSGQMDAAGRLYVPCSRSQNADGSYRHDNYIAIMNAAGQQVGKVPLDFTPNDGQGYTDRAADVAPSPDGNFLYVTLYGSDIVVNGARPFTDGRVFRFVRQADGSYRANSQAEWSLEMFPWAGGTARENLPRGQFLATDASGAIYLSAGLWTCQEYQGYNNPNCTDNALVKYRADGSYVTRFGQKVGGSWALGNSAGSWGGITVTADGRRVFATDINNSRVQRFDRAADGSYGAVLAMGMNEQNDPNRWGACFADGVLGAPYDVTLSPGGEVIVINTTCYNEPVQQNPCVGRYAAFPCTTIEVQRYGQDGSVRGSIIAQSLGDNRVHGIAMDRSGNIHLLQAKAVLRPAAGWTEAGAAAGGAGPLGGTAAVDVTAPAITALSVTPTTTTGTAVTIGVAATDNVGVTELRISEDGAAGTWRAFAGSIPHTIVDRLGAHSIVVEVRDAAGNVSPGSAVTVTKVAPPAPPTQPAQPTQPTQPKPTNPTPTNPTQPTQPTQPAQPGGGTFQGGGDVQAERPDILKVTMPVQVFRGTKIKVGVRAAGIGGVTHVRFSTAGTRWSGWRPMASSMVVNLPTGPGWKGVFVQVKDSVGTTSVPWFQPVLAGPRGAGWYKGTRGADKVRTGAGTQHVDVSSFDKQVDRVACGSGFDTVFAQPEDIVAKDCERVVRVAMPAW